ncbi:MAG: aminoacyl-tRNA hydrolase [Patescibacteria group bacterium]
MIIIIGLGNPGKEYEGTRHNAGRMAAENFAKKNGLEFEFDKKSNSLISKKQKVLVALPETFMNKSGAAAAKLIKPRKELKDLIVLHDDLDLPLGKIKISYGKNSGGHKGVESVMRALKTKNFYRVRIGVIPSKKKPADILKFIVGKFKPAEEKEFKKILKKTAEALETMLSSSPARAMSEFN